MHIIGGAHVQFVNNHYAKFECKGMTIVGVTDYTNQTPKAFRMEKMYKFNTPQNLENIYQMCTNRRCTFSMCEQSFCKVLI